MNDNAIQAIRQVLLGNAVDVIIAILTMGIALGSFVLQSLPRRTKDLTLFWFGLFAFFYGLRVLLQTDLMFYLVRPAILLFAIRLITFTIGMPAVMFGWSLASERLNWPVKLLLTVNALMAAVSIVFYRSDRVQNGLDLLNNVLAIGFTLAYLVYLFRRDRSVFSYIKPLRITFTVFAVFVVYTNLVGALFRRRTNIEFIGFFIFICSLGYITAARTFRNEEELASIRSELEIARRIQTSILPDRMPDLPGLQVAAQYLPMSEVAGDFYDFLVIDDKRLGVLIADVSGHGVPAALVASMVKVAIASQIGHAHDPALVMAGLNTALCGNLQGQFVTAAYLFLDLESMTVQYSAAGHPALLKYSPVTSQMESITENGLVLGVFAAAAYSSRSIPVANGERLLLYTDGVLEANRKGEEFGETRLQQSVAQATSAEQLCHSVTSAVKDWAGEMAGDDITVVAMQIA